MVAAVSEQKALALLPRFPAALSFFGNSFIIYSVVQDTKKLKTTYHRLMLGMSCINILVSPWYFASTWPMPTDAVYGAIGNQHTCSAQGFFVQFGLATPLYNINLALYYLLVLSHQWKEPQFAAIEPWMHGVAWAFAIGTAGAGLGLELYNGMEIWCWIAGKPPECEPDSTTACGRGNHSTEVRWVFFALPVFCCAVIGTVAMLRVYWALRLQQVAPTKWRRSRSRINSTQMVAWQFFWYLLAFFVAWLPASTLILTYQACGHACTPYWQHVLTATLLPLQGFLNALVYARPRGIRYLREHPEFSLRRILRAFVDLCCCRTKNDDEDVDEGLETFDRTGATFDRTGAESDSDFPSVAVASSRTSMLAYLIDENKPFEEEDCIDIVDPSALVASNIRRVEFADDVLEPRTRERREISDDMAPLTTLYREVTDDTVDEILGIRPDFF